MIPGDLLGDGVVGPRDLLLVLDHLGERSLNIMLGRDGLWHLLDDEGDRVPLWMPTGAPGNCDYDIGCCPCHPDEPFKQAFEANVDPNVSISYIDCLEYHWGGR
jgi:hypothetical protein